MVEMASRIVRNDSSTCRVLQKFFGLMGCKMQETLDEAVEPGYSTATDSTSVRADSFVPNTTAARYRYPSLVLIRVIYSYSSFFISSGQKAMWYYNFRKLLRN